MTSTGGEAKHARPLSARYSLPIGRVGALAVSLGIGLAVAHSSGVAYADTDTDSDSSVSASRDDDGPRSGPRRSATDATAPSRTGDTPESSDEQAPENLDDGEIEDVEPDPTEIDPAPADAEPVEDTPAQVDATPTAPSGSDDVARSRETQRRHVQPAAADVTVAEQENDTAATEPAQAATEPDEARTETPEPQSESITVDVSGTDTMGSTPIDAPVPVAAESQTEQRVESVDMMTALVSNLVSPFADPAAPARAPWFDAFLAWVRRQITHTFFNRTPVWGPVESHQLLTGQVEFDLNARDPNDDPLTYKISQPAHGLVTRNPLTDTFIYTPILPVTGQPLQDTFHVTISDSSEHLKGIGGLIQGIFHSLARIIGIAQRDEVTLAVSVTANPIVEMSPLVVVTPVAAGTVGTAVRVSPVVVITDLDSEKLASATVKISGASADDVLAWSDLPAGVSANYAGGVLTFTGPASVQAYQELLKTVTLTSADPGIKTVSFSVVDDQGNPSTVPAATVVTIVGLPVDLPPLVIVAPLATGRTDSAITVSPIVAITDIDSDMLGAATVRITEPAAGDELGWGVLPSGLSVTTGDGWVTFTGDASAETYRELLQSVTLTSAAPGLKAVAFSVVDDDGNVSTVPALTAVTVLGLPVEVPPLIVVTPVATGSAGSPITVSPIVVITDLDSSVLRSVTVTVKNADDDDVLGHGTLPPGVSASFDDGVLTFIGDASLADYQQLLRTVTLTSPGAGLKSVSFAVTDADGNVSAVPATTVVTVLGLPTELPPLVVVTPVATGSVGSTITVSPIVVITDLDSTQLRSATVTLQHPTDGDLLGHTALPTGVSAAYEGGVLTFSGEASVSVYRDLLQSVTLTSPSAGLKAVSFTVTDAQGNVSAVPAATVVTVLGLPTEVPPLVVVSPVAAGTAGSPIRISPIVVITDLDSTQLRSATVTVKDAAADDVLSYGSLPSGVSAAYAGGVLTFIGNASVADYQTLLASVSLTSPEAGLKAISFAVTDTQGNTSTVPAGTVVTVIGLPAEIPPLVVVSPVAAGVAGSAIRISPIVVITDLDSDEIHSATITLAGAGADDVFGFGTLPANVSADYADGVLTFTGDASLADYQTLLASVTLSSPAAGLKAVSFSVTDADGNTNSVPAATVVTVVGVPSAAISPVVVVSPVAAGSAGSPVTVSPIVVITDLDSTQLRSATVTVENPAADDMLDFAMTLPSGVSADYADGVLTFTGNASVATYRALLQSVTLTTPGAGLKAVTFTVTDFEGNTSTVPAATVVTMVGLSTELPPLVVVSPLAGGRAGSPINLSPIVVITDLDSDQLNSATVILEEPGAGDVLDFTAELPPGMSAEYAGGILMFTGNASFAAYRALLESVTLTSADAGVKAVSFSVTDVEGNESAVPAGTLVTVVGVPGMEIPPVLVVTPVAAGVAGSPVQVSPIVVIADVDSGQLHSATVGVAEPGADDVLGYTGTLPAGVSVDYTDGVLTFTGDASIADYQALLASVTLTSAETGVKSVSFTVTDTEGGQNALPAATLVTLVGVSAELPPLVLVSPVAVGRTGSAITVSPIVVITDLDSDLLASAVVTVDNGDEGDVLGFVGTLPDGVSITPGDGSLTFTGPASAAEFRELLQSVTLTSAGTGLKTVSFAVTDPDGNTSVVPAGTVVTVVGLAAEVAPVVLVSPVAAGTVGSAIVVSPIVVLTDVDSALLDSATVTVGNGDEGDVLGYTGTLPPDVTVTVGSGSLTFFGPASAADYRVLLQSVTLTSATAGVKTVSFAVTDAEDNTSTLPAGTLVTVVGVPGGSVPPLVVASPVAVGTVGSPTAVSPILVIADVDSDQLHSATVTLDDPAAGDLLAYGPLPADVSVDYVGGVLTFTGDASVQDYQALLRSVTLTSAEAGLKTVSFSVTDVDRVTSVVPAATLVTMVGLSTDVPPLVLVSPVAAGVAGSAIVVSPIVVITDPDSGQLHSATVTLADPQAGDTLEFTGSLPSGVHVGYTDDGLTFVGDASVEQYQALLRSVTLTSADAGVKTVSFSVTDVDGATSVLPAGTVVTVVGVPGVSMAPVVVVSPVAAGTVGDPITVSPIVVITDLDSSHLGSATVTLADADDDDVLALGATLPPEMDISYAEGVLTIVGSATVEQYRTLLQSVTLTSATGGLKAVSFTVTDPDGAGNAVAAGTLVTVVGLSAEVPPLVLVSPVAAGVAGSPIVVSPIVVITDPDSGQLHSATVTLTGAGADDVLGFTATLPADIDVSYGTGSLTFTGDASASVYQDLLQSVTLTSGSAGVKTIGFSVTDVEGATSVVPAGTVVTVVGVPGGLSMPPVLVVSPVAAGTVGEPTTVSPIVLITDLDSAQLHSATVTLADAGADDELAVTAALPEEVYATYDGGVLTITGTATVEQYQQLLESVTLTSASAGLRAVSFTVTDIDGAGSVVAAGTLVTVVGLSTDVPPLVLVAPAATGIAGTAIVVSPLVVISDPDSDQLRSATVRITNPSGGDSLAVTGDLPPGVGAVYAGGVLTITGNATVAQYQALLRTVTLTTASGGVKTVSFAVTDAGDTPSVVPALTAVTVVGLLDVSLKPVIVTSPVAAGAVGDTITVSPAVIITDLDSNFLRSATVRVQNGAAGDVLDYTAALPTGVQAEYTDGVLTFTGTASVTQYEALLASVTLTAETAGVKTVSYTVTDTLFNESAVAATTAVTVLGLPTSDIPPVVVVSLVAAGAVGRAIRVTPLTVIRDLDSSHLSSATVTLTDPAGSDTLAVDSPLPSGVQADYLDGVLTIIGTATVEQYQTLLQSVTLTSTTAGLKTVTFSVTDLDGTTSVVPATTLVTVVGVPQTSYAPVVVAAPVAAGTTDSVIAVSPLLVIADVDSAQLISAAVTVGGYQDGDVLDFDETLVPGVLGSYANGLLTFSGDASVADYQALLRSVTLVSASAGVRTVDFAVTDADEAPNVVPAATVVTVVGLPEVSLPPLVVASPVAAGTTGSPITVSPVLVVTDVDSALLHSATVTVDGYQAGDVLDFDAELATGLLVENSDGVLTFTGDVSVADYQALLRSVTLTSASTGVRTVSFDVTDDENVANVVPAGTVVTVIDVPAMALAPVVVVSPVAAGTVGEAVTVSPVVVVTDLDSDRLGSATVTVDGYQDGDVLDFDAALAAGLSVSNSDGVLTFTGDATVARYQALLASVTLTSVEAGLKSVGFAVTDLDDATNVVTATTLVTVLGVPGASLPPVIAVTPVAAGRVGQPVTVSPIVLLSDVDSSHIGSATVTVEGYQEGDVLAFDDALASGILGSYESGVLTFLGDATVATYEALLRSVTLTSASAGIKTVTFAVSDVDDNPNIVPAATLVTVIGVPGGALAPLVVVSPVAAGLVGQAITVSPVAVIADVDSSHLRGARVILDGATAGDVLDVAADVPEGIQVGYEDGVLSIIGDATVGEYQTLLRSVTLTSASMGVKAVSFEVTDIGGATSTVSAGTLVTVVGVEGTSLPPVVVVSPVAAGVAGTAIAVSPVAVVTDVDSAQLRGARVILDDVADGDLLDFTADLPDDVQADYEDGVLTFTGNATVAEYQALLRSVTLVSAGAGVRTVSFEVTDAENAASLLPAVTVVTVVGAPSVSLAPVVVVTPVAAGVVGQEITVSPIVVITDLDSSELSAVEVSIDDPDTGDVLSFDGSLPAGVDVEFADGVLTFTGAATVAQYREWLQSVTLTSTTAGVKSVGFVVVDAQENRSALPAATVVTVLGAPDGSLDPVLVVSPIAAGVTGRAITVSPIVLITDLDSDRFRTAQVTLADYQPGDILSHSGTLPAGVDVEFADGIVTFTGLASAADYQALLSSVTLTSASAGLRTVVFSITDEELNESVVPAGTTVTVIGLPVASLAPVVVVTPLAAGAVGSPIAVSPIVAITDLDSNQLESATVRVVGAVAGDVLSFDGALPTGVTVSYADGEVTFTGPASAGDFQDLLAAVELTSQTAGLKTVSFTVTDLEGHISTVPAATVVTVVGAPQVAIAPVVVVSPVAAGSVGSAITVSPVVVISDLDSDELQSATVTLTNPDDGDVLGYSGSLPTGVDVDYADGVLTFTGGASVAEYRALLESVTLTSTGAGVKTVSFAVTDSADEPSVLPAGTIVTVVGLTTPSIAPVVVVSPVAAGVSGSAITVSPVLAITDLDSSHIQSATVSVVDYENGEVLDYTGTLPSDVSVGYLNGVLSFTGNATVAEYQALLASVTFTSTTPGVKAISFSVVDGDDNDNTIPAATVVTVVAAPADAPPLVVVQPMAAGTAGSAITVSPTVVITDLDSTRIGSATVTVSGWVGGDVLGFTAGLLPANVDADSTDGVLTFVGDATVAEYQALLASVTFTAADPSLKLISFAVADTDGNPSILAAGTIVTSAALPVAIAPLVVVLPTGIGTVDDTITVSPIVVITDLDSTQIGSATVTIEDWVDGDVLGFTAGLLPVDVDADFTGGVLTFVGDATVAEYQALLASVTLTSEDAGLKAISFRVTDAQGGVSQLPASTVVTVLGAQTAVAPLVLVSPLATGTLNQAITVSSTVAIADLDSGELQSARIEIENYQLGDTLGFTGALLPTDVDADLSEGVLTFTGPASLAEYRALLASVTLTSTTAGLKSVSFAVTDLEGNASTVPAGTVVTVLASATEVPPLVVVTPLSTGTAGQAITVSPVVLIADVDSPHIRSATVTIGNPADGDALGFTASLPEDIDAEVGDGVLVFTGDASLATYQMLLQSVTLTSETSGLKTITFAVTDVDDNENLAEATTVVTVLGLPSLADPVVLTSLVSVQYTAGAAGETVDANLLILDPDSSTMSGATVTIENYVDGDTLTFGPLPSGVTGSYDAGVLTFSNAAPVSDYQELLRSVKFSTTASALASIRTLTFTVTDDNQRASLPGTVLVTVLSLPVQATPVVVTSLANVNYQAGASATTVDPNLLVFDVDSDDIKGAVVRIVGGASAGEALGFTAPTEIQDFSGVYDSATGVLTFTGTGSKAAYQELLRSVTFSTESGALATIKSISFMVTDAQNNDSAAGLVAVTILKGATSIPPLVVTSLVNVEVTLGDPALVVDAGLRILDVDPEQMLRGATVKVATGFVSGDMLTFDQWLADQFGIAGTYDPATGILTFSSNGDEGASLAAYQALLRSVTLAPATSGLVTLKSVSFEVTDVDLATSIPGVVAVTVLSGPMSLPPVVVTLAGPTYTAGEPAVAVNPYLTVADLDSLFVSGAKVWIGEGLQPGDALHFTAISGIDIIGTFDDGVLTLSATSGTVTFAQLEQALQSVTFSTTGSAAAGTRKIMITATDSRGATSAAKSVDIAVAVNTPPAITLGFIADIVYGLFGKPRISPLATIADNSQYLSEMVVEVVGGDSDDKVEFALAYQLPSGVSVQQVSNNKLVFTGTGTISLYQWVLRNVTLDKKVIPLVLPLSRNVTVKVTVKDWHGATGEQSLTSNFVLDLGLL